jgi:hypothetical protein
MGMIDSKNQSKSAERGRNKRMLLSEKKIALPALKIRKLAAARVQHITARG